MKKRLSYSISPGMIGCKDSIRILEFAPKVWWLSFHLQAYHHLVYVVIHTTMLEVNQAQFHMMMQTHIMEPYIMLWRMPLLRYQLRMLNQCILLQGMVINMNIKMTPINNCIQAIWPFYLPYIAMLLQPRILFTTIQRGLILIRWLLVHRLVQVLIWTWIIPNYIIFDMS